MVIQIELFESVFNISISGLSFRHKVILIKFRLLLEWSLSCRYTVLVLLKSLIEGFDLSNRKAVSNKHKRGSKHDKKACLIAKHLLIRAAILTKLFFVVLNWMAGRL